MELGLDPHRCPRAGRVRRRSRSRVRPGARQDPQRRHQRRRRLLQGRRGRPGQADGVVPNTGKAKNVILFLGDGMGISTVTAGRIYDGQLKGVDGESNSLSFEKLPYGALQDLQPRHPGHRQRRRHHGDHDRREDPQQDHRPDRRGAGREVRDREGQRRRDPGRAGQGPAACRRASSPPPASPTPPRPAPTPTPPIATGKATPTCRSRRWRPAARTSPAS
jgi:hypothetical protein